MPRFSCKSMRLLGILCFLQLAAGRLPAGWDEGMARYAPWSGSYWPIRQGLLIRGPLAKYDRVTGHRAADWEFEVNPPGPDVPKWFGYCHAWAAAAVMDPEPRRLRDVSAIDGARMRLGLGDQKGMLTACHTKDVAQHYGLRYTGEGQEDRQDIYPDRFWRVLRMYVKQQGIPIIVDIEAGTQVWNYPVYAYRVVYQPTGRGNEYFGEMNLWMADDAVAPDFLGVQVAKQSYYFTFQLRGGSAVMGSGRWTGPSVTNHPDFAWYPYIAVAENPEVKYGEIKRLVDRSAPGPPSGSPTGRHRPSEFQPRPSAGGRPPSPAGRVPGAAPGTFIPPNIIPPNIIPGGGRDPAAPARAQVYVLSPMELLNLVTNKTSAFTVDVTLDKFDGGTYAPHETFAVTGTSARNGYLYLLYLDSAGQLTVLFPSPVGDNRVAAQRRFEFSATGPGGKFRTGNTPGVHRIKAIVIGMPLRFSGSVVDSGEGRPLSNGRQFLLPPSQQRLFKRVLGRYHRSQPIAAEELGGSLPQAILREFAQDEVAFYVSPGEPLPGGAQP